MRKSSQRAIHFCLQVESEELQVEYDPLFDMQHLVTVYKVLWDKLDARYTGANPFSYQLKVYWVLLHVLHNTLDLRLNVPPDKSLGKDT